MPCEQRAHVFCTRPQKPVRFVIKTDCVCHPQLSSLHTAPLNLLFSRSFWSSSFCSVVTFFRDFLGSPRGSQGPSQHWRTVAGPDQFHPDAQQIPLENLPPSLFLCRKKLDCAK